TPTPARWRCETNAPHTGAPRYRCSPPPANTHSPQYASAAPTPTPAAHAGSPHAQRSSGRRTPIRQQRDQHPYRSCLLSYRPSPFVSVRHESAVAPCSQPPWPQPAAGPQGQSTQVLAAGGDAQSVGTSLKSEVGAQRTQSTATLEELLAHPVRHQRLTYVSHSGAVGDHAHEQPVVLHQRHVL